MPSPAADDGAVCQSRDRGGARALCGVVAILAGGVLLSHWPELTGWLSADPMLWSARLSASPPATLLPGLPGWNDPNAGITTQALGTLAARQWLHGVMPWWNPYSGVGLPLAAEMQNAALFLPFVLLLLAANGMLQRMSAEMDREASALIRDASAAFAAPRLSGPDRLMPAGFGGAPVAGEDYGFVASFSGNGVCTRSVTIMSRPGLQPQVVSDVSGNCRATPHRMLPVQQHVTSPTGWRHDMIRVKYEGRAPASQSRPLAWQG